MSQSNLIQTDRFVLSETERSSIEHEMHHYEDPRAASDQDKVGMEVVA